MMEELIMFSGTEAPEVEVDLPRFFQENFLAHPDKHFVARLSQNTLVYMLKRYEGGDGLGKDNDAIMRFAFRSLSEEVEKFIRYVGAAEGEFQIRSLPCIEEDRGRPTMWCSYGTVTPSSACADIIAWEFVEHLQNTLDDNIHPGFELPALEFAIQFRIV